MTQLRPPVARQTWILWLLTVAAIVLTLISAADIGFNLVALSEGADDVVNLIQRMLPPRIEDGSRIAELAIETLLIALLGTTFATVISVPLAFAAARNTTPHRLVYLCARGLITGCRAVPDLVFAVLFVRAMGIGVLPGVLALAMHSIGMIGKLFADAIERTDPRPREAVRSTGVGAVRELVSGVLPQVVPSWISTFLYRIDINLRTSVVLGFVGAGGIGFALQDALRGLVYDKALGIVLAILLLIGVIELVSMFIRRTLLRSNDRAVQGNSATLTPPWTGERVMRTTFGALLFAGIAYAFVSLRINPTELVSSFGDMFEVAGRLVPPDFTTVGDELVDAIVETLAIGLVATAIAIVLSLPLGLLAARNVAPIPVVYWGVRGFIVTVRAIPELILAVVFVAAVGLGPLAGVCALGIGSIGFFGKLVADAVEELDPGPAEAIRSVGGGWWKVLFAAILPQALPSLVSSGLYLLDVNIRTSTILGIVGAGGVGFLLFEAIRTLNFEVAGAIILTIFVIVFLIEQLAGWVRTRLV